MRVVTVELFADDVEALTRFYREVIGVPLEPGDEERSHYETYWGEWRPGTDNFFFFTIQPLEGRQPTRGVGVTFQVDDLTTVHERVVAAGAEIVEQPADVGYGRLAVYRDPAGNLVSLLQP